MLTLGDETGIPIGIRSPDCLYFGRSCLAQSSSRPYCIPRDRLEATLKGYFPFLLCSSEMQSSSILRFNGAPLRRFIRSLKLLSRLRCPIRPGITLIFSDRLRKILHCLLCLLFLRCDDVVKVVADIFGTMIGEKLTLPDCKLLRGVRTLLRSSSTGLSGLMKVVSSARTSSGTESSGKLLANI